MKTLIDPDGKGQQAVFSESSGPPLPHDEYLAEQRRLRDEEDATRAKAKKHPHPSAKGAAHGAKAADAK